MVSNKHGLALAWGYVKIMVMLYLTHASKYETGPSANGNTCTYCIRQMQSDCQSPENLVE